MVPQKLSIAVVGNALPDVALAAVFLITWIAPGTLGDGIVRRLFLLLLMELIVIQASGLMGLMAVTRANRAARGAAIVAFAAFYTIFAVAVSIAMRSWWPLVGFWALTFNRLLGVILNQVPDEQTRAFVARGWVAGVTYFLAGLFLVFLLPLPALGLTPSWVADHPIIGGEAWSGEPQKLMAFGVFYFGLTAWSEVADHNWARRLPPFGAGRSHQSTAASDED